MTKGHLRSHQPSLRTRDVVGIFKSHPTIGEQFRLWAEPLDPQLDTRLIETSPVTRIDGEHFWTRSGSHYTLEIIGEY